MIAHATTLNTKVVAALPVICAVAMKPSTAITATGMAVEATSPNRSSVLTVIPPLLRSGFIRRASCLKNTSKFSSDHNVVKYQDTVEATGAVKHALGSMVALFYSIARLEFF